MMVSAAHSAPRPIGLATWYAVCSVAPSRRVIALANRARERSTSRRCTIAWHYNRLPAHLAGHDNVVRPHILQTPR
jgi:hypothetical protein